MEQLLQPLRVPGGWHVMHNTFREPNPDQMLKSVDRWDFTEDLFQAVHSRFNRLIDLGWYPSGDLANGSFLIVLYAGDFHGELLHQFRSRDHSEVTAEIERLLALVASGGV